MLILPLQRKLTWLEPPILTLLLVIINVCIFTLYQTTDNDKYQKIFQAYEDSELLYIEVPLYLDYLERNQTSLNVEPEFLTFIQDKINTNELSEIRQYLALNLDYVNYLHESKNLVWEQADVSWWEEKRALFYQNHINTLSNFAYGYIPNDFSMYRLFSHQFMHGSYGHLIGNMIILFILGFGLERMLSRSKVLLVYLLSGAVGALSYASLDFESSTTLVGASGAISGLMGLFVGIWGLQKIRFFYFILFAFGYFRSPAIILLPIWIANELIQFGTNTDSNVAYFAHIGGFISGGLIGLIFKNSWLKPKEDKLAIQEESDQLFTSQYAQALKFTEDLKFDQAKKRFLQLWNKFPKEIYVLDHLYHLYKIEPTSPAYHKTVALILTHNKQGLTTDQWRNIDDYLSIPINISQLNQSILDKLVSLSILDKQHQLLENIVPHVSKHGKEQTLFKSIKYLSNHYRLENQSQRSEKYNVWLQELSNTY